MKKRMDISLNPKTIYGVTNPADAFPDMVRRGMPGFELWQIAPEAVLPLREAMDSAGTHLIGFCPNSFNLTDPAARDEYLKDLRIALADAATLRCPSLITQVGNDTGAPRAEQHESIINGLRACVPLLEAAGVTLLVEPLNTVKDHVGYYLNDSREGFEIVRAVASPNVRLLFDIYHQLQMGEPVLDRIREGIDCISHFHVAGIPARDEKIWEGVDYSPIFRLIGELGYRGHLGMELFPSSGTGTAFLDRLQEDPNIFISCE